MKNLCVLFLIFIGISVVFTSCVGMPIPIQGNGDIITTDQKIVSSFDKIGVSNNAIVKVHKDSETRVTLTVDSNLLEYVELKVWNTTLNIGAKWGGSYSFTKFIVDIYCPNIVGVSISDLGYGSGKVELVDKIITPSFNASVSGSGKIEGAVESNTYSARVSGSGNIVISGTSKDSNINVSGSGDFNGKEFKTNNCTVKISGSGDVSIWVIENLKAHVSGSGKVTYLGRPKIDFSGTGSSKIRGE
jgi:hypothetical protein